MAKNVFAVTYSFLTRNGISVGNNFMPGISINLLPFTAKALFLSRRMYLTIRGEMDISEVITKAQSDFDVSYFPRLIVYGSFRCSQHSKAFPGAVYGCFDCSKMPKDYINKDFNFPIADKINCAYSINNYDVLIGLLPDGLECLVVEPKLIRKDFLNENTEVIARFLDMYPNVIVMDTHGKLLKDSIKEFVKEGERYKQKLIESKQKHQEILDRLNKVFDTYQKYADLYPEKASAMEYFLKNKFYEPLKTLKKPDEISALLCKFEFILSTAESFFKDIEQTVKTDGKHYDGRDVFGIFRQEAEFNNLSDDELNRYVRYVISMQRNNGIKKQVLHRMQDDTDVVCIMVSDLSLLRSDLQNLIIEWKDKTPEKIIENTSEVETPVQTVSETAAPTVNPITIKKYIKLNEYKEIEKSSGTKNAIAALQVINEINRNPLDMQFQGAVHVIKEGKDTVSKTATKEFGCCVVQSIDSSNHDDNKRIVWKVADGPDGLIMVCIGFIKGHDKPKTRKIYAELLARASQKTTYTAEDLADYMEVSDILNSDNAKSEIDRDLGMDFSAYVNNLLAKTSSANDLQYE